MRRRLTTLAAAAMFALAFSVTPVLADSHGDHWVVVESHTTDLTGSEMLVTCGQNTYEVFSGTVHFVWRMRGNLSSGVALDAGRGITTWVLNGVRVRNVATSKVYRVVGSQRVNASWPAGADVAGDPGGPFSSFSFVMNVQIPGTGDGRSLVMHQLRDGTPSVVDSGSCSTLTLYGS